MARDQALSAAVPPDSRGSAAALPAERTARRRPRQKATGKGRARPAELSPTLGLSEHELLRATVTSSPTALTVLSREGRVLIWNPAAERLFGFAADEVLGRPMPTIDESNRDQFKSLLEDALQGRDVVGVEVRRRHRDGHLVDAALWTVALHDAKGKVVAALGAYQDISARKAVEAELIRQAQVDDLTGMVNRNGLLEHLRRSRAAAQHQLAVVNIDVDHFKQVNDALGHPAGDRVLGAFAERLGNSVRPGDVVASLEGAAFAVLMPGLDARVVESVVDRLLRGLTQAFVVGGHEVELQVTAGVALQYRKERPAEVVRRAGVALHYA
ncbi:MAG: diguanylate cyclase domain-containing protein, partial [Acidimicrobiales bacterium]